MSTRTPDGGADGDRGDDDEDGTPPSITLQQRKTAEQRTPPTPDVRLYHRAVVVAQEATGACGGCSVRPAAIIVHQLMGTMLYWFGFAVC